MGYYDNKRNADASNLLFKLPQDQLNPQDTSNYNQGHDYATSQRQSGPFRGGLTTNFNQFGDQSNENLRGQFGAASEDQDSDVRGAASAYQMMTHGDAGTSNAEQSALLNMYTGRIGHKNALSELLNDAPSQLAEQEGLLKLSAGQALGQGLKETRGNYSRRGLLYSGSREGAEQRKRGQVASSLSSGLMGAKRNSSDSVSKAQNAYAQVGLERENESFQLANQAFETAHANNIARLQAMQQLGHGLGSAAGTIAGSYRGDNTQSGSGLGETRDYTASPGAGRSQLMQGAY